MQRWTGRALALAFLAVSCSGPGVETERVDPVNGPVPTAAPARPSTSSTAATSTTTTVPTTEPVVTSTVPPTTTSTSTTVAPSDAFEDSEGRSPTQAPTPTDDPTPDVLRDATTNVGDELFPTLGSSDVDVESYTVKLSIGADLDSVDGEVEIRARVPANVVELPLDAVGLDVRSVTVDGAIARFETTDDELVIALAPGHDELIAARIIYAFEPDGGTSAVGLPAGWFPDGESGAGGSGGGEAASPVIGSYVLNEPDGARTWLPSNDHPSDKAFWNFEITVPDGVVAAANGELSEMVDESGPTSTWSWTYDETMPTYLVQVIVGDYEIVEAEPFTSIDGRIISITHVVPAGERATFQAALDSVPDQMAYFEQRFGPYPLDRYGLAFVNGLTNLAMETQGRSMFGADDFASGELGYFQELLLAHELAHQWFGNAVSPLDWSDIWLNESFASYLEWLWLDSIGLQPLDAYAEATLDRRQFDGESTGAPSLDEMFGFARYHGGAVVVHALRSELGDEVFFDFLAAWIADNNGTSQSTEAFVDMAERAHGSDLTQFFDDWLYSGDLPDEYPSS